MEEEVERNFEFYSHEEDEDMAPSIEYSDNFTLTPQESSNVAGASYDGKTRKMIVTFKERKTKKGTVPPRQYEYYERVDGGEPGVTVDDWVHFKASGSKGTFINEHIIPKYKGVQL